MRYVIYKILNHAVVDEAETETTTAINPMTTYEEVISYYHKNEEQPNSLENSTERISHSIHDLFLKKTHDSTRERLLHKEFMRIAHSGE